MSSSDPIDPPDGHLNILSLVTTDQARFYLQQTDVLERAGVSITTLSVPGANIDGSTISSRSPLDYLRFFPIVLGHELDFYDLVHANFGLTAPMALAQRRLPVVLSLWGTDVFGKYGLVGRLSARLADEVIVMSREMADELGVDAHVIPHGIDMNLFEPTAQRAAQRAVGWDPDVKHVLFPYRPGRKVKNYPLAKRVVEAADDRLDDPVDLKTVYGLEHEAMPPFMNAADALILPSQWEGSPNSVKEALACNLPVVATDVGDVRERLAGVYPSSVCRSESELVAELCAILEQDRRSNGRDAAAEVGIEEMASNLISVYESAAESGRHRSIDRRSDREVPSHQQ